MYLIPVKLLLRLNMVASMRRQTITDSKSTKTAFPKPYTRPIVSNLPVYSP